LQPGSKHEKINKSLKGRCAMDFKHDPDTDFKCPEAFSKKEAKEQVQALRKAIE
jgi:hypothetical protein